MAHEASHEIEKSEVALREEAILAFWKEHDIFNKTLKKEAPKGDFVFYDGPPFATGLPHYGHILAGTIKDAIPRFWTMRGYHVPRRWGWDCHGLPLENLIEKKLGLATKRDIETYGIKNFNEAARDAVLEYADDWREIVPRMGRWADMEHDYKTMDSTYTESVWWVFSELHRKGLVYEGFKSMHLCPRCGTTLSNFEVNQGYKDIKDIAVTVKMPLLEEGGVFSGWSLLIWTTTPWTLPGNMAVAVNRDLQYAKVLVRTDAGDEQLILAKDRLAQLASDAYEIVETVPGKDLVGMRYVPPFAYFKDRDFADKDHAWKIYHADYVEIGEEGTGAVHIAPAYGEEDMNLAKAEGIPIIHHVDKEGHFMDMVTDLAGQLVKPKDDPAFEISHLDADIEVLKLLQEERDEYGPRLYRKENITHSYPHCWRCDTPLLNYATTSWFVEVTKFKDALVAANNTVNWVPKEIGSNRFGNWLEGARDWAISRQRYWGAPLPIWRNSEGGEYIVIGSKDDLLSHVRTSGNTYYLMRHAQSELNVKRVLNSDPAVSNGLTENGKAALAQSIEEMPKNIDCIFYSPLPRAAETALLIKDALGLKSEQCILDDRLREVGMGAFEGKELGSKDAAYARPEDEFDISIEGTETLNDVRTRMGDFLYEIEARFEGKRILIVSHGDPLWLLESIAAGEDLKTTIARGEASYPQNAELRLMPFVPLPHNDRYELDYHRPYIDTLALVDENGAPLTRVEDVFDCWFESGSMPYGQNHYPFENLDVFNAETGKGFPSQFIAEGLDQTRGWFYSLMVLGVALLGKSPYENVIVNGLVLAEDGKKMSKSLQNYPDPQLIADTVGVDAMRYYLLSAPVVRAEDLNFSEKAVLEQQRKNIGRLHNVLSLYELFADGTTAEGGSNTALDSWILARLNELINEATDGFLRYELDRATRPIADFIDDLSVWYVRRSRERLKAEDQEDKKHALATLRYTLKSLARVMAPVMPFYAEYLWQQVKEDADEESVHLSSWPEVGIYDSETLETMAFVRKIVNESLELRTKANIKVRQPLLRIEIMEEGAPELNPEYRAIICDELNVKEVSFNPHLQAETAKHVLKGNRVALHTEITPELKAEGDVREFIRSVQELRKKLDLQPRDRISLTILASHEGEELIEQFRSEIQRIVGADAIEFAHTKGEEVTAGAHSFTVAITRRS